jgi:hypothetical protein
MRQIDLLQLQQSFRQQQEGRLIAIILGWAWRIGRPSQANRSPLSRPFPFLIQSATGEAQGAATPQQYRQASLVPSAIGNGRQRPRLRSALGRHRLRRCQGLLPRPLRRQRRRPPRRGAAAGPPVQKPAARLRLSRHTASPRTAASALAIAPASCVSLRHARRSGSQEQAPGR